MHYVGRLRHTHYSIYCSTPSIFSSQINEFSTAPEARQKGVLGQCGTSCTHSPFSQRDRVQFNKFDACTHGLTAGALGHTVLTLVLSIIQLYCKLTILSPNHATEIEKTCTVLRHYKYLNFNALIWSNWFGVVDGLVQALQASVDRHTLPPYTCTRPFVVFRVLSRSTVLSDLTYFATSPQSISQLASLFITLASHLLSVSFVSLLCRSSLSDSCLLPSIGNV